MIGLVCAKLKTLGMGLSEEEKGRAVLKVIGNKEFLLHKRLPLYMYDCADRSFRLQVDSFMIVINVCLL